VQQILSLNDILKLDKIKRINLVNSLSGFKSANLIGTTSKIKKENLAIFSSVIHVGSDPPLLGFLVRPNKPVRHTYTNIKQTGIFTINHVCSKTFNDAHHTSAKYPEDISEFEKTNLTPEYNKSFLAPFVKESSIKIGLSFKEEHKISSNNTIFVVGQIELIILNKKLEKDGFIDLTENNTATINGLSGYSFPKNIERKPYQRPK
tara:strand:- start:82793 stop:83407 length:615 start_codon:yes stop_codon:yes gene_type:complete